MFIAGAHVLVGLGRHAGTAGGALVDDMRREAALAPNDAWDLAFVHHVGWHPQRPGIGPYSAWPFDRSMGHEALAQMARSHGLTAEKPAEGDIVLHWCETVRRHERAGIVVATSLESCDDAGRPTYHCVTVAVDTPPSPVAVGGWVREVEISICPQRGDLLVRWTLSEARQAAVDSRRRKPSPRAAAAWAFDEQLGRCA
jgi:hypothetical protein